ncbi:MAG: hypothetical protein ACD_18C00055G0006 [uncultured bacterium]|nr:MAG: hypothetical protein ACD_18C00055G0006 [uncultured bacterium]OGH84689.1 MAG: hypothetical protein A2488_01560 [Candidatus Magasanikbacteria bacterium RIFOXYC12_FULL_32_21b]OGH90827.1 MAG: hypothetical protein A2507_00020 [Candidatus Magasanikbacteria bacterium RIFOXYD12_FULL_33_17]HAO52090.1 hypothetical protein [Candidatus Magasanikbacteria bacterium]
MNLRQYIATMLFATILCWVSWFFVILNVDPASSPLSGFLFFYGSLFLSILGTLSIIFFFFYRFFGAKDLPLFRYVQISFRQSLFLSLFMILALFLQGQNYLNMVTGSLLLIMFVLIISFNISVKHKAN